jgi:hypothetical protein
VLVVSVRLLVTEHLAERVFTEWLWLVEQAVEPQQVQVVELAEQLQQLLALQLFLIQALLLLHKIHLDMPLAEQIAPLLVCQEFQAVELVKVRALVEQ